MSDPDAALIFLHIPKTAGSTLSKILQQHYSKAETVTLDLAGVAQFKSLPLEQRAQYRLVRGHFYFGLHRFIPRPSTYVTFLRHPIERAVSFYYYARSKPDHYLYPLLSAGEIDLKTLLDRGLTTELHNDQTRMLAGEEWEDPQRAVNVETLARARENLRRHFRVVGLQEEFDASVILLHRAFGWPMRSYKKQNVTKDKPLRQSLDVATRKLLEEKNSLDLELYEEARALFDEQCGAEGDAFVAALNKLRGGPGGGASRSGAFFRRILRWAENSLSRKNRHLLALCLAASSLAR